MTATIEAPEKEKTKVYGIEEKQAFNFDPNCCQQGSQLDVIKEIIP